MQLAIYDGFPKARYHFLILPRIPFTLKRQLQSSPTSDSGSAARPPKLALAGGKLTLGSTAEANVVPASHLRSLQSLLASPYARDVLQAMRAQSQAVVELIREEMRHSAWPPESSATAASQEACNVDWNIHVGFHAVPSMDTVHLHVISDDLVSSRLKNKKHYLSFHPTHGFWLDLDYVMTLVERGKKSLPYSERHYEELLKKPLSSFRSGEEYSTIPKLKAHLEQSWVDEINAKRKKQNLSNRASDDELPPSATEAKRASEEGSFQEAGTKKSRRT